MGPVRWRRPALPVPELSVSMTRSVERLVWLVTTSVIGPAPKRSGETCTRPSLIDAVMVMGEGGRGVLAESFSGPQRATSDDAAVAPSTVHCLKCPPLIGPRAAPW